jgi:hypothetical protein
MRIRLTQFCLAGVLSGCQTIEYGPVDGEITPVYGYQETQTREGEYTLTVRALGGTAETVHLMWDRRARELCGAEYQKTLYRAERPTANRSSCVRSVMRWRRSSASGSPRGE